MQGAGGFGKTTVAKMVRADRRVLRRFRGRVYWVTVGRDAARETLAGLVNGLIARMDPDRTATFTDARQAAEHLAAVLAKGPRRLLVLDDVWTEDQLDDVPGGRAVRPAGHDPDPVPGRGYGSVPVRVDQMTDAQALALLRAGLPAAPAESPQHCGGDGPVAAAAAAGSKALADQVRLDPDVTAAAEELLGRLRADGILQVDELTRAAGQQLDVADPVQRQQSGPGDDPGQYWAAQPG